MRVLPSFCLAVFLMTASAMPALAQPNSLPASVRENVYMRNGPGYEYQAIALVFQNRYFDVYGCLKDWSWCDVAAGNFRGWIPGHPIQLANGSVPTNGRAAGIPFMRFDLNEYWGTYYRDRDFYREWNYWRKYPNRYPPYRGGGYYPMPPKPPTDSTPKPPVVAEPDNATGSRLDTIMRERQQEIRDNLNRPLNRSSNR